MTLQSEIATDKNFRTVLDHGFVGLVQYSGSDEMICRAARVSYGQGTKTVRENRGLIRYLMRHKHTSPFEMADVTLHIKLPIFVMRQLVRHRTSSLNEYSGRYSVLTDEFYVPEIENIKPQSDTNKQGRSGILSKEDAEMVRMTIQESTNSAYDTYKELLGEEETNLILSPEELERLDALGLSVDDAAFSDDFPGIARELARSVMPVAGYTELYWKQNLHNLFHMLRLRMDSHAQWEIQAFANAIYELVKPLYPEACQAFEDYIKNAENLSSMEKHLLDYLIQMSNSHNISVAAVAHKEVADEGEPALYERFNLTKREWIEFKSKWNLKL